jgi:hypothetical protein
VNVLILLPGILSVIGVATRGPRWTLLYVYLPSLLLLPQYHRFFTPGLPDPTFSQAAIVPIALSLLAQEGGRWKFSQSDFLTFVFAFCVGLSQILATGYKDAQNLIVDMAGSVLMPYMIAKMTLDKPEFQKKFVKQICLLACLILPIALYEFRFGLNLYLVYLEPALSHKPSGWFTAIRWGYGRIAGPYGHSILAGMVYSSAWMLTGWLIGELRGEEKKKYQWMRWIIFAQMIMTMSRGPWLGSLFGVLILLIGRVRDPVRKLRVLALPMIFAAGVAVSAFSAYVSVNRAGARSATQETAAYRKELYEKYIDIALAKSWTGWGLLTWPQVDGMWSVDNHWLLLALRHGIPPVIAMALLMILLALRLGLASLPLPPPDRPLMLTLAAIIAMFFLSAATVYLGLQAAQMLFMVMGWSDAVLKETPVRARREEPVPAVPLFRHVMT